MKPAIRIADEALLDIESFVLWYDFIKEGLSVDFEFRLNEVLDLIESTPVAFQNRYREVHIVFLKQFPFGVHYVVDQYYTTIIGVFHTSRNPVAWFKRPK